MVKNGLMNINILESLLKVVLMTIRLTGKLELPIVGVILLLVSLGNVQMLLKFNCLRHVVVITTVAPYGAAIARVFSKGYR